MKLLSICFITGALLLNTIVLADEVKIPIESQTPESQKIIHPKKGETKTHVKSQFGEPQKEISAIGKPPISSWVYAEFTVYFENDHVIDSVTTPKLHENKEIIIKTEDVMSEDAFKIKNAQQ